MIRRHFHLGQEEPTSGVGSPESVEKATVAGTPKPVAKRRKPRPVEDPWAAYAYGDRWGYGDRRDRSWSYSSSGRGGWNDRW